MKIVNFSRRRALQIGAAAGALIAAPAYLHAAPARFVIIGGGFGGAAAARAAKAQMPNAEVILLSNQKRFWMCPGSNAVIAGMRDLDSIEVGYDTLIGRGIDVRFTRAEAIDADKHHVMTSDGETIRYDKLILSPGIDLNYSSIEGLSEDTVDRVPHAWKAGPQTILLADQLAAMPDGGLFVMSMPRAPYRCPPAPAERACLVAHYLKHNKPGARLLILDAKDSFPFLDLFTEAWDTLYSDIIEYRAIADDGAVREVDPETLTVFTDFDEIKADVLNVIPPQTAGRIAMDAGATDDTGWCPIDIKTFASTLLKDVYVIGDSALTEALPKAGSTAASQARVAVDSAVADLTGTTAPPPSWIANCYSQAAPDYGLRLGASYHFEDDHVVRNETDFSVLGADADTRESDARYAEVWLEQIKSEIWG